MSNASSSHYGDCNYCKNLDSARCDECEHLERDLRDNWEEETPADVAEREAREFRVFFENAITGWIDVSVSDDFRRHFATAKRFTTNNTRLSHVCLGVYADPAGYLVATDAYSVCKLNCNCIPDELKGKVIITLEEGRAGICDLKFPFWEFLFDSLGYSDKPYSEVIKQFKDVGSKDASVSLTVDDFTLRIKDEYLELVEAILGPNITMRYRVEPRISPVIFVGAMDMVAVQPLLNSSDLRQGGSAVKGACS